MNDGTDWATKGREAIEESAQEKEELERELAGTRQELERMRDIVRAAELAETVSPPPAATTPTKAWVAITSQGVRVYSSKKKAMKWMRAIVLARFLPDGEKIASVREVKIR